MPLLLLFIAVPLIEIALFIKLGSILELGWILLIVVLTAILGTFLVRRQGRDVLANLSQSMNDLRDPTGHLAHGAMILFSGALLLTPGFFTDAIGFLLLVPAIREAIIRRVREQMAAKRSQFEARQRSAQATPHDTVIDGEFEEVPERDAKTTDGPSGWTRH